MSVSNVTGIECPQRLVDGFAYSAYNLTPNADISGRKWSFTQPDGLRIRCNSARLHSRVVESRRVL